MFFPQNIVADVQLARFKAKKSSRIKVRACFSHSFRRGEKVRFQIDIVSETFVESIWCMHQKFRHSFVHRP